MNRRSIATAAACLLAGLVPPPAYAHFVLVAPPSFSEQSSLGDPQKSAPCGQADPGDELVPSGVVTPLEEGSMVTITIDETIYHPGHYRVALAMDQASLPDDPPVTAGETACGSTVISENPTLPVLADGLLPHSDPFGEEQTIQVQLPAGFTCDRCTLQIIEFMSDHGLNNPGGCFYHHCATVSIGAGGGPDGGPSDGDDAGPDGDAGAGEPGDGDSEGCGCRTQSSGGWSGGALLGGLMIGFLALRRRRR